MRKSFIVYIWLTFSSFVSFGQDTIPRYFELTDTSYKVGDIHVFDSCFLTVGITCTQDTILIKATESIYKFMTTNPTIKIEISSYCGYLGSLAYNDTLTDRQAKSCKDYLIAKGVSESRIVTFGYGERKPRYVTKKIHRLYRFLKTGSFLTEDVITKLDSENDRKTAYRLDIRVEIKILKK